MTIEELARSEGIWNSSTKDDSDIVLKSSIKFFRNIEGYVFAHKLIKRDRDRVCKNILEKIENNDYLFDFSTYKLNRITPFDKRILVERNIIQDNKSYSGTLLLSHDQYYYFVLGEKDHIEYVIIKSGFYLNDIYGYGKKVILNIENKIGFAFSEKFGYLTAHPENSGPGIEIVMTLHLPGLIFSSRINEVVFELEKKGIGVRSSWVDGYYEVFNKYSRGLIEKDIYENTFAGFQRIIKYERESREKEYNSNRVLIEDKVWRSYGILLSSRLISLYEALDLLSYLRLGISLGIISYLTIKDINLLLFYIQDFHLKKRYNIDDEDHNMEKVRAQFLIEYLKEVM